MPFQLRPDAVILQYRLLAAVGHPGSDVWRAEDTRHGRTVALKVLSRSAPKERGRRDALLSKLRQAAAFVHPAFPVLYEINASDDGMVVAAMEWIEGESGAAMARRNPASREQLVRWAYQLAEALAVMHRRDLVHGNFSPANIIIDPAGNLRLLGLTASALSDRRERGDIALMSSAGEPDLEALSYRSPEELTGKPIDRQADVFSFGGVIYYLATGQPPFHASSAQELLAVVSKNNPRNPMELNPQLDPMIFQLIGKSIYKNSQARYHGFDPVLADLEKLEPKVKTLAAYPKTARIEKPVVRTMSNLFVAELPYYELLLKKEPARAVQLSAKMQQILGEAVYLFDGEVVDSIGPRMIGIVPDSANALRAARRALADLAEHNAEHVDDGEAIEPRMVLHRDEIVRRELAVEGSGVDLVTRLVGSLEPMQMLVSETLLHAAGEKGTPVGEFGGVQFCQLPAEMSEEAAPVSTEPDPSVTGRASSPPVELRAARVASPGSTTAAASAEPVPAARTASKNKIVPMAAGLGIIVLSGAATAFYFMKADDVTTARPVATVAAPKTPAGPPKLFIEPFTITSSDATITANAALLGPVVAELLRQSGKVEIAEAPEGSVLRLSGKPAGDPAAGLVPQLTGKGDGPALQLQDGGAAATQLVTWVGQALNVSTASLIPARPGAMDSFARAAAQYRSGDAARRRNAQVAIEEAIQRDPDYVPAQRLALEIHSSIGDRKRSIAAGERLVELGAADRALTEKLLVWKVEEGRPVDALAHAGAILAKNPSDLMALQAVARYAISAGEEKIFQRAVQKIEAIATPEDEAFIHRADLFAAAGDNDRAAKAYYEVEAREPNNPVLALKIGRIAALRESWEIADLELKKLQRLNPDYGAPMLEAYIAAKKRDVATVGPHLAKAIGGATWRDDVHTHAAEIYALLSQKTRVIESLEKAAARGEANITPVLLKQPFYYIGYDSRSSTLKQQMEQQRENLKRALFAIRL